MIARREWTILGGCAAIGLLMPLALLIPWSAPVPAEQPLPGVALRIRPAPPLARAHERPLFSGGVAEEAPLPGDAPQLVGIVGRLGADAVALVRAGDGASRTLRIGESVDGWQLASLAIDAAFFTRGAARVRVPLPAGE